jgi:hypothetical protein
MMPAIKAAAITPTTIPAIAPAPRLSDGVAVWEGFEACEYVGAELDVATS